MYKPEVRVIETQMEEVKTVEVSNWEKQQLLAKYGYSNKSAETPQSPNFDPTRDLSYEELIRLEDQKYQMELERKMMEMRNRPKSYTIDTDQVRYNETRWSNIDDTNIGFEVTIVSDMKIPGMRY
jgi:hypothetical protein